MAKVTSASSASLDAATLGVLGALTTSNVVANVVLPSRWYVPWNLTMTGATLAAGSQLGGRTVDDVGLASSSIRRGALTGVAAAAAIGSVVAAAASHPTTRQAFVDERGEVSGRELAVHVLFHVPAGTALLEEVAFRGVLPALFEARPGWSHRRAVAVSAALFGAWHVLPSLELNDTNQALSSRTSGRAGQASAVVGSVVTTSIAGLVFSWLRDRSGSLLAPIVAHSAVNAAGHLAAWGVARAPGAGTTATDRVHVAALEQQH